MPLTMRLDSDVMPIWRSAKMWLFATAIGVLLALLIVTAIEMLMELLVHSVIFTGA